jgi:hypothetical protein
MADLSAVAAAFEGLSTEPQSAESAQSTQEQSPQSPQSVESAQSAESAQSQDQGQQTPNHQDATDIRNWSVSGRDFLVKGRRVNIYKGHTTQFLIATIPTRLVIKASVIADRLLKSNDGIHLPNDTDVQGVLDFLNYMVYATQTKEDEVALMKPAYDTRRDLCVCGASYLLGMQKYSANIWHYYWSWWSAHIPTYEEIDLITHLPAAVDKHATWFYKIAGDLAIAVRDGTLPDADDFDAYLDASNHRLRDEIFKVNKAHADYVRRNLIRQQQQLRAQAADRKRKEVEEFQARRAQKEKEDRAKEKEKFDALKVRDAALEKAIKEKMKKAGVMFTIEEKQHWLRSRGSRPPKGR